MRSKTLLTIIFCVLLVSTALAGDPLRPTRERFRNVLKSVSADLSKNFHDPTMNGLDWKAATAEARTKIDNATSLNEMEAAIFELTEKLDDSHTFFVPPMNSVEAKYGFEVKP